MSSRYEKLINKGKNLPHDTGQNVFRNIDNTLVEQGCKMFQNNYFSMFVCMLSGLFTLMYIPSIVKVLENTKQSGTPEAAFRRYLRTLNHMLQWYDDTPEARNESLKTVRRVHAKVAVKNPMTQYDMVLTQWAFVGPVLIFPTKFGIQNVDGLNGIKYIIYLVGQAIGIDDDLNLCSGNFEESKCYAQEILESEIQVHMKTENNLSLEMGNHLLHGIGILNPYIKSDAFKIWIFKIFNISKMLEEENNFATGLYVWTQQQLFSLFCSPYGFIFTPVFNSLIRFNIYLGNKWEKHIITKWKRKYCTSFVTLGLLGLIAMFVLLPTMITSRIIMQYYST